MTQSTPATNSELARATASDQFTIRTKVFKLFGEAMHVYDPSDNLIAYCKLKAFKLKEDIRLFASEAMERPLLAIKARSVIDFSAGYDVFDLTATGGGAMGATAEGVKIGTLRRRGFKSMLRDEWELFDAADQPICTIKEDSQIKALVRRFVDYASAFMPQKYHGEANGQLLFTFQQNFNPFVKKLHCDFGPDTGKRIDRRLGMAAAILLQIIEGRQA